MLVPKYELVLTIRARRDMAVTKPLLPPLVVATDYDLLKMLTSIWIMYKDESRTIDGMSIGDLKRLAAKVEADVRSGKYKWELENNGKT